MIHRRTAHPTPNRISRRKGALLEDRRSRVEIAHFIPTHANARVSQNAVVHHQRFVIAEIAIRQPKHQTVANHIESVRAAFLRNTGSGAFYTLRRNPGSNGESSVRETVQSER